MARVALVAAIVLAAVAGGSSVRAAFPGANGEIAFVRGRAIWVVAPDGSSQRPVTRPAPQIYHDSISWSPNGALIMFIRGDYATCGLPCFDLYTVRPDGTALTRTNFGYQGVASTSRWSPDGGRVAFVSYFGTMGGVSTEALYAASVKTGETRRLAPRRMRNGFLRYGYEVGDFAWSPNGGWICFSRVVPLSKRFGRLHLALVRPDGTGLALLAALPGFDCGWAPDGQRVVFTDGLNISSVGIDGTGLKPLTNQSEESLRRSSLPTGARSRSSDKKPAASILLTTSGRWLLTAPVRR